MEAGTGAGIGPRAGVEATALHSGPLRQGAQVPPAGTTHPSLASIQRMVAAAFRRGLDLGSSCAQHGAAVEAVVEVPQPPHFRSPSAACISTPLQHSK